MNLEEAMVQVRDQLTAAGVRATIDTRDINPPCVLIRPPSLSYRFGKGCWDAQHTAWALVPSAGMNVDLASVGQLLEDVQAALDYIGVTATPADATLPDGSTVPMYELTWTDRIPSTPPSTPAPATARART